MAKPEITAVHIMSVANGYMVRPSTDYRNDSCITLDAANVFESFNSLVNYLRETLPQHPPKK